MDENDAAIVDRVRAGEVDAFRVLVGRHSRNLFGMAYRMTGNSDDADDIVQETFLRAYRQIDRFESRSSVGTWLYRIAANCALDHLRSRKTRDEVSPDGDNDAVLGIEQYADTGPSPDRGVYDAEIRDRVMDALDLLTPVERTAFVMRHFQDTPLAEIGRALGLRENATKNTIFRAVQKLRRALQPLVGGAS